MGLFLNPVLLPLLLMAAQAEVPLNQHYPRAIEVFHCNFDQSCDANFDGWPDGWTRRRGQGYPGYVKVKIQPIPDSAESAAPGARQCLQVDLDGGGAVVFSPPIEVGSPYSYVLEGWLHTQQLELDRAFLSVTFLDADKHPLVTFESEKTADSRGWKKISLGPIAPPSREIKLALIGLHVEPRDAEDLKGSAAFADIRLVRLPRLELKTNQPHNLFLQPAKVEVTCTASGFADKNTDVAFKLFDALGRCLADDTRKLGDCPDFRVNENGTVPFGLDKSSKMAGDAGNDPQGAAAEKNPALSCTVSWEPPIPGPGFYRVQAELRAEGAALQSRDLTLAAIEPRRAPAGGEFGWTLPNAGHPIPLAQLSPLLGQAGINWVKYPLWFSAKNGGQTLNQLLDFGEQLNAEGIELVGLLNDPPDELRERFPSSRPLSAAEIFAAGAKVWFPSLEPVVSQLAGQVRWWQLGDDADDSLSSAPDFADKLAEVKKELDRAARDINLGVGWDCGNALPSPAAGKKLPLRFAAISSRQPLSPRDLAVYLDAAKDSPQMRWVSLKPLSKSSYSTADRAEDLVKRMIAAKIHGADAVFCPDPFDADCGLMNKDGTPGDLFLPWRTAALELGGAKFLGAMQLPHNSQNLIFVRANDAVMILWNDKPVEEVLYLGEDVKQLDLWGRACTPDKRQNAQVIDADALPAFVTGLMKPIARWYIDLSFDQERMPSITGRAQANGFRVKNPFPGEAAGTATIVAPRGWIVDPRQVSFHLAAGEELQQPISLTFPDTAASGRHAVRVEFEIQADRPYKFSVIRHIEMGLGDVRIEYQTRLNSENKLEVQQRFINSTDQPVSFRCELFAPDRRRLMLDVLDQGRGQNLHTYDLQDGKELFGKTIWLRAAEIDGPRILNYRFTVKGGIADRE